MTLNDKKLNEFLVRAGPELRQVSDHVRAGNLNAALTAHALLENTVRQLGWRINDLYRYPKE